MRAVVALLLTACAKPLPLDVDVELRISPFDGQVLVDISVTDPGRSCSCTSHRLPPPGECTELSDLLLCDCSPWPGQCLTSIRVERQGAVVAESGGTAAGFTVLAFAPPAAGATLVLEGCGGRAEVPLTIRPRDLAVVTGLHADPAEIAVRWAPRGADTATLGVFTGQVGVLCRGDADGELSSPAPPLLSTGFSVTGLTLSELWRTGTNATPLGEVRTWDNARRYAHSSFSQPTGVWSIAGAATSTLYVDGREQANPGAVSLTLGNSTLTAGAISLTPGELTDTVRYVDYPRSFEGTIPHVAPAEIPMFGDSEPDRYVITVPEVTVSDAAGSHRISFTIAAQFDPIPAVY